jgi:steroid delta-isomerase
MPSPEAMRATLRRYIELVRANDVEGLLGLFADGISVEDPVDGPPGSHVVGGDAVAAFFRKGFARSRPAPTPSGPIVTTGGREAAMPFTLRLELGGVAHEIDVVDVMTFDDDGRITRLRAYWNAEEARRV